MKLKFVSEDAVNTSRVVPDVLPATTLVRPCTS